MHKRGAMSARTHTDVVIARQPVGHLGRIDIGDIQCHDGAAIARIASAIHLHAGNARHGVGEMLRKRARMLVHAGGPAKRSLDVANTRGQARHAMRVQRTRFEALGHEKRVALVIAVRARASFKKRGNFDAACHAQASSPLRAQQAFMARKAHHVGTDFGHVQRIRSSCLRGIEHEFRARFMGHGAHARHIVHIARKVRRMRNHDQRRLVFEQFGIYLEIKRAIGGDRRDVNRAASRIAQAEQRTQHRIVRCGRSERPLARSEQAVDGDIERHGGIVRERHARSARRTEQIRHRRAGAVYRHARRD